MRTAFVSILSLVVLGLFLPVNARAQAAGDFRSASNGDWSAASTWETFDGANWTAATAAPTGAETIWVAGDDTVRVDVAVTVSGAVRVTDTAVLAVEGGTLVFADGSTYEHARDAGDLPVAEWAEGSTFLLTGTVQDAPSNRNQDFHHVTINTPGLGRNRDMGWNGVTIGGDLRIVDTGGSRWQLTSAAASDSATVTILGDVLVEGGQFAVQGTGNAFTEFFVHHYGDLVVTGGNFSVARGSQGSGTGSTTWYLYGGDFSMSNASTQNSNPTPGNAKFVFAGNGAQQLSFDDVTYAGGRTHFEVSDSTTLEIRGRFELNGQLVNRGQVALLGELVVLDGGVYEHARNGGIVPPATWEEGSTARFTGITADAPENRAQDYHHLTLDTPGLTTSRDLGLTGHTIGGDLSILSSGNARWRLVGGSSGDVTLRGDLIVRDAQFETQGTSSATDVTVHHYGDVVVDGGNFSISRGSQGSGTGTTTWILYDGDFSMSNARTQNSNPTPGNAKFVFASDSVQTLALGDGNQIDNLSVEVSGGTTLDLGASVIGGNGVFVLQDGATLATSHAGGLEGNLRTTGLVDLGTRANVTFNGAEAQVAGGALADSVQTLTIANAAGVTVADSVYAAVLRVLEGATLVADSSASLTAGEGTVDGTVVNRGEIVAGQPLVFGATGVYEHARNGGSIPSGVWSEGATARLTGVTDEAPANRGQNYHHLVLDTPGLAANLNLGLSDAVIGGDVRVVDTGSARWYLLTAAAEDTAAVTLLGDVIVEGGQFSVHGTGNASTDFAVYHFGDVEVTGGNFSIARGSQAGTGTTTWYLYEGDFSMSGARAQNSNKNNSRFVFNGDGVQRLVLGEGNTLDNLPIEVNSGTTLDVGTSELTGADLFTLNSGATLVTAHPGGVAGSIQTTGPVTLDTGASFTFNGSAAQVTGTLMPATVNDLVVDNAAGVTLSQETTINGVLRLLAGVFDNTIPFTLGPEGSISREGGSILVTTSSEAEAALPAEFQLHQNYPNPFNPSTTIRYDLKEAAYVTVRVYDVTGREVAALVDEQRGPGSYQVQWNAAGLSSGVYFYHIRAGAWSDVRSLQLVK